METTRIRIYSTGKYDSYNLVSDFEDTDLKKYREYWWKTDKNHNTI